MNLLIDLGNSRLKWAQQAANLWRVDNASLDGVRDTASLCRAAWSDIDKPVRVLVCSVSSPERLSAIEQWTQTQWAMPVEIVRPQVEQLGVKNRYRNTGQLGADRWVALIGARGLTAGPLCVVDAGTAVTVDALSNRGEFLGGVIFPGLSLLRDSLVRGTSGIPLGQGHVTEVPARSTEDGVAAGTLIGLAGAIERLLSEMTRELGGTAEIFLTGGDASHLASHLRISVTPVPDLVLRGLARIADSA